MLGNTAQKILKMKYAKEGEEWDDVCLRVAEYVSSVEKENKDYWLGRFYQMMLNRVFIPGGRILANSNTGIKNLMNCLVLDIEDSRNGIYKTLGEAAELFAHGYGIGYNFSKIREKDSPILTTGGKASGPLSFASLFDQTGEVISQASRRGAQMMFLDIDHPDIESFITFKSNLIDRNKRVMEEYTRNLHRVGLNSDGRKYFKVLEKTLQDDQLTHFNISVGITDDFIKACLHDEDWNLVSRTDGSTVKTVKANYLLELISNMAWESGDPGVAFWDRINEDNLTSYLGQLKSSNPCSELFLFPGEGCCLGSINLHAIYDPEISNLNLPFLEEIVRTSVRFLDNVQTISESPIENINKVSKGLRRLGLGVMGWADLLAEMEIPYDSEEASKLANYLSWFISFFSILESLNLAQERGAFSLYDKDKVDFRIIEKTLHSPYQNNKFDLEAIRENGLRNVATTSIAPTGTIALLAEVNSSIEPYFALAYRRNITEGVGNIAKDHVIEINPILFRKLKAEGFTEEELEEIKQFVLKTGSIQEHPKISDKTKAIFKTSGEISPASHVFMQASWQEFINNSISKTINLPEEATPEDIQKIILLAWNHGIKSLTVYRNNSKSFQILEKGIK